AGTSSDHIPYVGAHGRLGAGSIISVCRPRSAQATATARPAGPAPTTRTSGTPRTETTGRGQPSEPVDTIPPSTRTVSPVIHDAASETRKPTMRATSSGVPSRFIGYALAVASS